MGLGFQHRAGGIDRRDHRFSLRFVGIVEERNDLQSRNGSHLPRVVLDLLNPANQRLSSGLGFAHSAGRYRSGGPQFLSTVRRHCRCVDVFKIQEYYPILPGCDGNSRTVANRRSASGVGVYQLCWEISTRGITVFVHGSSALPMCGRLHGPGMDPYLPRVVLGL